MSTATCPECGDGFEKDAAWKKTCMPCWKASKRPECRQPDTLLTSKQETAVVAWLAQIGESEQTIIDDVLTLCRQDGDARAYYLDRAGADSQIDDDRRRCSQCSNLRAGVCVVARPGGVVSAIRGYRPALPDILQRCAGYSPNASDTDQRPGSERWPGLTDTKGTK